MTTWTLDELEIASRRADAAIDAAYRTRYARYASIVPSVVNDGSRAAPLALVPAG